MADMRHDAVQTLNQALKALDLQSVKAKIKSLSDSAQARLDASGVRFTQITESVALDMLYQGQTHTLSVNLEPGEITLDRVQLSFERAYQETFGRVLTGVAIRVLNLRYTKIGLRPKFDLSILAPKGQTSTKSLGSQRIYHQGAWWDVPRYDRLALPVGACIKGPAILEQIDTTVWIEPGFEGRVDEMGLLLITLDPTNTKE
jgi:N-methylhydantoinase A